ncbi:GIY-YIG nuclease family protein [Brevibacillus sp. SYSU BS000544]|uniref:GIY-YIG nuclease family protein n=1 Tax=Brevibacillus sp. SYSU BS000544 TaxID=3416443 RepID=UPI003CE58819
MTNLDRNKRNEIKREYKEMKRKKGVYQITNLVNGKIFIGSNRDLDTVFNRIRFELDHNSFRNKQLQDEWLQYGEEQFRFEVIDVLDEKEREYGFAEAVKKLGEMEQAWLEELQPYGEKGYHGAGV